MAVPYITLDDVVENMIVQCGVHPNLSDLTVILEAYRVADGIPLTVPLLQDGRNAMLKILTGCVVATETDLNCYPSGLATTICFDIDGNPVP